MESVRNRVISLLESINGLYSALIYSAPYPALLLHFNLILAATLSLSTQFQSLLSTSTAVVPTEPLPQQIIATLLRTKQTPALEQHHQELIETIDETEFKPQLDQFNKVTKLATNSINQLALSLDGDEWSWKARLETNQAADSDDDQDEIVIPAPVPTTKEWTVAQLSIYERTGQIPSS